MAVADPLGTKIPYGCFELVIRNDSSISFHDEACELFDTVALMVTSHHLCEYCRAFRCKRNQESSEKALLQTVTQNNRVTDYTNIDA